MAFADRDRVLGRAADHISQSGHVAAKSDSTMFQELSATSASTSRRA